MNLLSLIHNNNSAPKTITYLNPVSYVLARKELKTYAQFDEIRIDGILLVKFLRFFMKTKRTRRSFDMTSDASKVFEDCSTKGDSIYFLGTKPKLIDKFIGVVTANYPKINIAGFRNGYFSEKETTKILETIIQSNPSIVVIGMGVPLQEKLVLKLVKKGYKGVCYTCGGFMHQTSEGINYYPKWVDKMNLRMPYRIIKEAEFRKRLHIYILFVYYFFVDLYSWKKHGKQKKLHTKLPQ